VAIVTGAAMGIGRIYARRLLQEGARGIFLSFVSSPLRLACLLRIGHDVPLSARCVSLLFALSRASMLAGA
jgi:NAD(P)-dependent dehydrogenase (short-subunit alcohol dehydrogenase family)